MYTVQYLFTIEPAVENIAYHKFQLISVTNPNLPRKCTAVSGGNVNKLSATQARSGE